MKMIRDKRARADAESADGVGGTILSRRRVLGGIGGLAALPVLAGIGSAVPAVATPAQAATASGPASAVTGELVRGPERRYNAPHLVAGTRLVLPAGIRAVAVQDYYSGPRLASAETAWPSVMATNGTTVDASIVPERGAPTRIAILSGFAEGWYELVHASGRVDRVMWDSRKFPVLWLYGEYGATKEAPYHNRFYTLALRPFSRSPYSATA
ncbi:MAG TPA: hypothetical protein VG247_06400 [Pseudonocardiaceae bacterium]|nr:hypothetical protein [Pseudonocardiaceae bacterium]